MAFEHHSRTGGGNTPIEYLPAAAGTYQAGKLLKTDGGVLKAITADETGKPQYLCVTSATVAEGGVLGVERISGEMIYETSLSAATAGAKLGAKLQISAGGTQVDGKAAGCFEVVYAEGTAKDAVIRGRFVEPAPVVAAPVVAAAE